MIPENSLPGTAETVAAHTEPAPVQVGWGPSIERGKWTHVSSSKELSPVDNCLQRKNWFYPMESHWIYEPHSGEALCPAVHADTKTNSMVFL